MIKFPRKITWLNTIRRKMLIYSLFLIFIMLITNFYVMVSLRHITNGIDYLFTNNVQLTELSKEISTIDKEVLSYLNARNSINLDFYMRDSDNLRKKSEAMIHLKSYDTSDLMMKDIGNIINEYLNESDAAVVAKRGRDINECNIRYKRVKELEGYLDYYIKQLNLNQFHENTDQYFYMSEKLKLIQTLNIVAIGVTVLLNVILILWFTNKICVPIVSLAESANEISKGNFDAENVNVHSDDEIKVMADAFNKMKDNIRDYIDDLMYQAEMEAKLMDEKMQNLKMKNLLKNAEIQALQSQINPHFLFNTLNAGVQLAMMEDAERTGIFLEKMSNLFRYNLRKMDKPVTLLEEIQNLYAYTYIMETRFGDMIQFEYDIDKSALEVFMPSMVIQPVIENSCIHGIGHMEQGGKITLKVEKKGEIVQIIVRDNGKGMDEETIQSILNPNEDMPKEKHKTGHTTGIGIGNVIKRLRVFYETEDVIEIQSEIGAYTSIILKLPIGKGGADIV